jgi:hypothetical protein
MNNEIKLIKVPGLAPSIINSNSLFDVLLSGSKEISLETVDILKKLRDVMSYGGEKLEMKIEQPIGDIDPAADPQRTLERIFDVPSFDIAAIFPAGINAESTDQPIIGHQICLCRADENSDLLNNWYRRSLQEYFQLPPGGSLLTVPGIQRNLGRFWLLRPSRIPSRVDSPEADAPLVQDLIWKDSFEPQAEASPGYEFRDRFDQFGKTVFEKLAQVQSAAETAASVILWIYVGPIEQSAQQEIQKPEWGVSLFAVIKPRRLDVSHTSHWMNDAALSRSLLRAVRQLYFYLALAAYRTIEQRRLMHDKSMFQMNVAQSVAHEFKNLTQDISSLGSLLHQEFSSAIEEAQDEGTQDPAVTAALSKPLTRLYWLSALSRLTSAVSLATYWLTTPNSRQEIIFEPDPGCKVFQAAIHIALELCKGPREEWEILNHDYREAGKVLGNKYGTSDTQKLVKQVDVALLLFVVSEPVRNIRSKGRSKGRVLIHTRVDGRLLYICQKTFEAEQPASTEISQAAGKINRLLQAGGNITGRFARLNETIQTVGVKKHSDGYYEVDRETEIEVFGVPRIAN